MVEVDILDSYIKKKHYAFLFFVDWLQNWSISEKRIINFILHRNCFIK